MLPFVALRSMATLVHAVPGAAGELSWSEGEPIAVRAHPASALHPCGLRGAMAQALAAGSCEGLSRRLGRRGEPSARLLADARRRDLGGGVQRFALAHGHLDVFVTTLDAHATGRAVVEAATLPASFRTGPCRKGPPDGLGVGITYDELTRLSVVWLTRRRSHDDLDETAAEAAWAMAGACAAAEATLGV